MSCTVPKQGSRAIVLIVPYHCLPIKANILSMLLIADRAGLTLGAPGVRGAR